MWAAVAAAAVLGWAVGVAMPLRRDAPQEEETPMADRPVPPRCGKDTLRVAPPTPPLVAHAPQEGRPAARPGRKSDGLRRTEMRNIRDDSVDYGLLVPLPGAARGSALRPKPCRPGRGLLPLPAKSAAAFCRKRCMK